MAAKHTHDHPATRHGSTPDTTDPKPEIAVTAALIPAAGSGTRVFPVTTAIEKCMLPVYAGDYTRPLVDFAVMDCIRAGVTRIIFVCNERGKQQLEDYYGSLNPVLAAQLEALGKSGLVSAEKKRRSLPGITFEYIIQQQGKYGTAIPLHQAKEALKGEKQFVFMGADDFVWNRNGPSELARAIANWRGAGSDHLVMGNPVDRTQAPKYGVLQADASGRLLHIDEKPPLERVPQAPLTNISRYLFSESIWPLVDAEIAAPRKDGQTEYYITDVINAAATSGQTIHTHRISGTYLDGGSPDGLLFAGNFLRYQQRAVW